MQQSLRDTTLDALTIQWPESNGQHRAVTPRCLATEGHMIEKVLGASDLEPGMQVLRGGRESQ